MAQASPTQVALIQQQAHQLSYRQGRVGVVELEAVFIGKTRHVEAVVPLPVSQYILQAGGGCVLLAQAQLFAVFAGVIGVEHHGDLLGLVFTGHRPV